MPFFQRATPRPDSLWDQWRGPARDGQIPGRLVPTQTWPRTLTRLWSIPAGEGHASPLIVGDMAILFAREGDDEVLRGWDLRTGKARWRASHPAPYTMHPAAQGHGKGPKATPVVARGRIVTLGISGIVSCHDLRTGKVLWRKDFAKEYPESSPSFGAAASPIVVGTRVLVSIGGKSGGGLAAFDLDSGAEAWRNRTADPAYASPVLIAPGGVRQIVTQTRKACAAFAPGDGALLWSVPFATPYEQNSVTPVPVGDRIVFGGTRQPTFALAPRQRDRVWSAPKVWDTTDVTMYMSTPVVVGGRVVGMSEKRGGQLFVLDPATGKVLWTGEGRLGENVSIFAAGDTVLALGTDAQLRVLRLTGDRLDETARYTVAEGAVWASPAFARDQILVKDVGSLTAWQIRGGR